MALTRLVLFLWDATKDFLDKNCHYLAAAISFFFLFSIFPLSLAVISTLGFLIGQDTSSEDLAQSFAKTLPVSNQFVGSTMEGVVKARAITGIASFIGLIWASSAAFSSIRKGINAAWGVTVARPYLRERLIDIGLVFGAGVLILIILFTAPAMGVIRQIVEYMAPDNNVTSYIFWDIISRLVSPILAFLTILVLYRWMPNTHVSIKYIIPGALLSSICFWAAQLGFVWYVSKFSVYNVVYGSIGAIMALLAWVYISALIILFGALMTSRFHEYASHPRRNLETTKEFWTGFSRVRVKVVPISSRD